MLASYRLAVSLHQSQWDDGAAMMRDQTFHLPNPAHEGTIHEGTFDECNDEGCGREHQVIALAGVGGTFQLVCEHQLHVYVVLPSTPIDSIRADIETILGCRHDEEVCAPNGCDHEAKGKCRPSLIHVKGTIPEIVEDAFGGAFG